MSPDTAAGTEQKHSQGLSPQLFASLLPLPPTLPHPLYSLSLCGYLGVSHLFLFPHVPFFPAFLYLDSGVCLSVFSLPICLTVSSQSLPNPVFVADLLSLALHPCFSSSTLLCAVAPSSTYPPPHFLSRLPFGSVAFTYWPCSTVALKIPMATRAQK